MDTVLIFVNYRRGPHSIAVAALAERLARHFGADSVFHDSSLESGTRYPDELRRNLNACHVLIAVIHPGWPGKPTTQHEGHLDWVEFEITTALAAGKPVIPVLLDVAELPEADELPTAFAELTYRQATKLRADHYSDDVDDLIHRLDREVGQVPQRARPAEERTRRRLAFWSKVVGTSLFVGGMAAGRILSSSDPVWLASATQATFLVIGLAMANLGLCAIALIWRPIDRLQLCTSALSFGRYAASIWGIGLLIVTILVLQWAKLVDRGSDLLTLSGDWRIFLLVAGVVALLYWFQRLFQVQYTRDREWPPRITSEPAVFRRAAYRLRERLTTWPEWRAPRSRTDQEQAVSLYLELAEIRLEIRKQAGYRWQRWLLDGKPENNLAALCLGVTFVAMVLLVTAAGTLLGTGDESGRLWALLAITLILIVGLTATAIGIGHRIYTKHRTWLVDELTEMQAQLGPLIFVREADARRRTENDVPTGPLAE